VPKRAFEPEHDDVDTTGTEDRLSPLMAESDSFRRCKRGEVVAIEALDLDFPATPPPELVVLELVLFSSSRSSSPMPVGEFQLGKNWAKSQSFSICAYTFHTDSRSTFNISKLIHFFPLLLMAFSRQEEEKDLQNTQVECGTLVPQLIYLSPPKPNPIAIAYRQIIVLIFGDLGE
jgi:hypothetical protein